MTERFDRKDLRFFAICAILLIASTVIVLRYFEAAFPEASIDFQYNRSQSRELAEKFLNARKANVGALRHASLFDHDNPAKIFLERTLGLASANGLMKRDVKVWYWRHRWFKPLQTEEWRVDVAPTGEIVAFEHTIPEERSMPPITSEAALAEATRFLAGIGIDTGGLHLTTRSEKKLPNRVATILDWESIALKPGDAPYRYTVTFDGDQISRFRQYLDVPDKWLRDYRELRSKNQAAGGVDSVFMLLTIVAALAVFVSRLRRGDLQNRFAIGSGAVGAALMLLVALNGLPSELAGYDTRTSFAAFIAGALFSAVMQGLAVGLFLVVIVGAGEALYRQSQPGSLAIPSLVSFKALRSRRVFKGFILGYTLVGLFMAYQVVFYLVSSHFGAWSPADIPYDDILNTAFPWAAVLFMGFFPAMSEEYMSRAFSIPFLQKLLRSRVAAVIVAGLIWGFGHAGYPNQPFYIRGLEVGIAGIVVGFLMIRFGLLPLLVWHYTIDALYTSLLLFRSGNLYYIVSGSIAALVFALPIAVALILYKRHGGFESDNSLENGAIGTAAPDIEPVAEVVRERAPSSQPVTKKSLVVLAIAIAFALLLAWARPDSIDDVAQYSIDREQALKLARGRLAELGVREIPERSLAVPDAGFRTWDAESTREDGGSPGGFDLVTLEYIVAGAPRHVDQAIEILRTKVEGATWVTRFFTPRQKREIIVEIDPRTSKPLGFHEYLDETTPGARLAGDAAAMIATDEFANWGLDTAQFEKKETLEFKQPGRTDWLFHFEDRTPLTSDAKRRVSVRVAGDRVTQFAKTVWIPEKDRRKATEETIVNTIVLIIKIAGILGVLALSVIGFVISFRERGFPWRGPAKIAALLVIPALAAVSVQWPVQISHYDTSIAWQTFLVVLVVGLALQAGVQLGAVFVATAAIENLHAWSTRWFSREVRAARGRADLVAGMTAAAILLCVGGFTSWLVRWFPTVALIREPDASPMVAFPLPAILAVWETLTAAIIVTALVATIAYLVNSVTGTRRTATLVVAFVSLACALATPSASVAQMPLMALRCLIMTAVIWFVLTKVVAGHPLALPVAVVTLSIVRTAASLLSHGRIDLTWNGVALLVLLAAMILWLAVPSVRRDPAESTAS